MNSPNQIQGQTPRFDGYRFIHKALRAMMTQTLIAVGKMDPLDACEVAATVDSVRTLLTFCSGHIDHEDRFIHTRMEARAPGSSKETADDHSHHDHAMAALDADILALEGAQGPGRIAPAHQLYRNLAVFVADNMLHMHVEETENNAVLWKHYSDQEIMEMEDGIRASLGDEERAISMKWMFPNLNAVERANAALGARATMPPAVFNGLLAAVNANLDDLQRRKLGEALAVACPSSLPGMAA